MAVARETVRLGLSARGAAKVKVRQPLHEAVVVAEGREREAIEQLADIVRDELNVKELRFVERADELGSYEVKPNYRTLGPRFGKQMPEVAEGRRRARPGRRSPPPCATADRSALASTGDEHASSARTTSSSASSRSRATSSSARARTRWRWSWRSTTTCAARASRARSSTPCRTRARRRGSRSRTASR